MRLLAKLATVAFGLVTVIVACGGDDDATPTPGGDGSGAVTEEYCTRYCNGQASSGTLTGSRAQCQADCCKNVQGGCAGTDASVAPSDAGRGADACAKPCGDACCGDGEGCGQAGGQPTCVKTCRTSADCPSGCCAPATNLAGEPVGPYVCKQTDGSAYGCCSGLFGTKCGSPYCCVGDTLGNHFCSLPCSSNGQCGAAACTGHSYDTYYTNCPNSTNACGPGL